MSLIASPTGFKREPLQLAIMKPLKIRSLVLFYHTRSIYYSPPALNKFLAPVQELHLTTVGKIIRAAR